MKLKSAIDTNSEAFKKNFAHHKALADQLRARTAEIAWMPRQGADGWHLDVDLPPQVHKAAILGELALLVVGAEDRPDRAVRRDRDHEEIPSRSVPVTRR